jgi:hypothetical protein
MMAAIALLAQTNAATASEPLQCTRIRFIHASLDSPPVDVLRDSVRVFTTAGFGHMTDYTDFTSGTHTVTLQLAAGGAEILTETLIFTETDYTLAAAGTLTTADTLDFELLKLVDDNTAPSPGMVRARFVHLIPNAPAAVDIAIQGQPPLFEGVVYRDVTEYVTVASGTHTLVITVFGVIPVATADVTVVPNNVYSFFAIGNASGTPEPRVLQVLDESHNHQIWLPMLMRGA